MRFLLILFMCMFIYCNSNPEAYVSTKEKFFRGNHPLESIEIIPDSSSARIYKPTPDKEIYLDINNNAAHFIFKSNTGEYIAASLPYEKMRFIFISEESTDQPYCKFRWTPNMIFSQANWQINVVYYVVAVKKSQIRTK